MAIQSVLLGILLAHFLVMTNCTRKS